MFNNKWYHTLSLFMRWGAAPLANPYISREWPYLSKRFHTCPFIFPKDSKKNRNLKFFAPPFATRPKFFAPPLTQKFKVPKIPTKHEKTVF